MEKIKKTISENQSDKYYFNEDFSYSFGENDFFYYETLSTKTFLGCLRTVRFTDFLGRMKYRLLNLWTIAEYHVKLWLI